MKKLMKVLLTSFVLIAVINLDNNVILAGPTDPVDVVDENFRACINDKLGQSPGDVINEGQLNTMTGDLNCASKGIVSIEGAEHLTALSELYLNNNAITAVDNINWSNLSNLTFLSLDNNQITDLSTVDWIGVTSLVLLSLHSNPLEDISTVDWSGLTNLTHLMLDSTQISDISTLNTLTTLNYLSLHTNQITNLSALSSLTNLSTLYLSNNQITDISALGGMTNLFNLFLSNQTITLPSVTIDTATYQIPSADLPIITDENGIVVSYEASSNPPTSFNIGEELTLTATWNKSVPLVIPPVQFGGIVQQAVTYSSPINLTASNFSISLNDVNSLNELEAKNMANISSMQGGSDISNLVTVNASELNIIQTAMDKGVYDLTFSVTNGGESETITIKVFVVDDNDIVDELQDIVLMADDFQLHLSEASTFNDGLIRSRAQAYKYSDGSLLSISNLSFDHSAINSAIKSGEVSTTVTYDDGSISVTTPVVVDIFEGDEPLIQTGSQSYILYIITIFAIFLLIKRKVLR